MPGRRAGRGRRDARAVVLVSDLRAATLPAPMAGDLPRPVSLDHRHHELVTGPPDPDAVIDVPVRDRVAHPLDTDRGVPPDPAGLPKSDRHRMLGQHVQPCLFLGQHLHRWAARRAVDSGVHPGARNYPDRHEALVRNVDLRPFGEHGPAQ